MYIKDNLYLRPMLTDAVQCLLASVTRSEGGGLRRNMGFAISRPAIDFSPQISQSVVKKKKKIKSAEKGEKNKKKIHN